MTRYGPRIEVDGGAGRRPDDRTETTPPEPASADRVPTRARADRIAEFGTGAVVGVMVGVWIMCGVIENHALTPYRPPVEPGYSVVFYQREPGDDNTARVRIKHNGVAVWDGTHEELVRLDRGVLPGRSSGAPQRAPASELPPTTPARSAEGF